MLGSLIRLPALVRVAVLIPSIGGAQTVVPGTGSAQQPAAPAVPTFKTAVVVTAEHSVDERARLTVAASVADRR